METSLMTRGLNVYDFYRDCYHSESQKAMLASSSFDPWRIAEQHEYHHLRRLIPMPRPPHPVVARDLLRSQDQVGEVPPCIDSNGATKWLNRKDVQAALNVEESQVP